MYRLFKRVNKTLEHCFYVETNGLLNNNELKILKYLLADGFVLNSVYSKTRLKVKNGIIKELGPRMSFATAWSTNFVNICQRTLLGKIIRVEKFRRYAIPNNVDTEEFVAANHDRMTEEVYLNPPASFTLNIQPETVYEIPLKEKGPEALLEIPGLAMDEWDRKFYYNYFVNQEKRNPTVVEIMDLNNANSEHSRHGYFKGKQIIDGVEMPETLMEIVKSTLKSPSNSVIAFKDNSSAIQGYDVWTIMPEYPGIPSAFNKEMVKYHIIFTAETHNFPSGVAPFPGAETGTGGRIRDDQATGSGGLVVAGTTGYCVGNLYIPDYDLPWEDKSLKYPEELASGLKIEIEASNGASDYGNKFGEPVILGFTRSFDQVVANQRWAWIKPIMFTGGIGQIDDRHVEKGKATKGLLIVQVGGPAYRIGVGGGGASSLLQGENTAELDFNAVQRGDAEMENKMNRVIRTCIEMGDNNPIVSAHDQGAGGPANVLKELVEDAGGRIEIRKIKLGDVTMSVLEIWIAEYQERCGFLITSGRIREFQDICERENVNCEILGSVTDDGRFIVYDMSDNSTPVNLDLDKVLGNMPQKTFRDERIKTKLPPLEIPEKLSVTRALTWVLRNLCVGSKRFLTSKVDRSVTGLVVRQPCCGPMQLTVADCAIIAQSHFGLSGAATSIGEQPIKMLVNPKAGARMAVGEALTNLIFARVSGLSDIKCSANWMWAPKLPGEGAVMYEAAVAMRGIMSELGIGIDGGKDSLSMATKIDGKIVKSPRQLVISTYCTMPDITRYVTPDIKKPGRSQLIFIDLAQGKCRLGGSALAHILSQIGNVCPDVEDENELATVFEAIQYLLDVDLILAGHDIGDGGLIVTLLEMAFAGNCGWNVELINYDNLLARLFAEELGLVIECEYEKVAEVYAVLKNYGLRAQLIGRTTKARNIKMVGYTGKVIDMDMEALRSWWENTSYEIEKLQMSPECAEEESKNIYKRENPEYVVSFKPKITPEICLNKKVKPEVAILREEGSNGDREMASAFYMAGFKSWDITMTDLKEGRITLDRFQGLAAVGGFSYADVPESAKGWAATIRFNPELNKMFKKFYERPDTFSLDVCNGCQLFTLLGWVPWPGIPDRDQPRFIKNSSGRFESHWVSVRIEPSQAIMFKGMENSVLGIWVAHGEGKIYFPDSGMAGEIMNEHLVPVRYVDDEGLPTTAYPFNPNGSPLGIAGLCSSDGRHLAMMPHPERTFLKWQWGWMPERMNKKYQVSAWLKMFQNAYEWCENK